MNAEVTKVTRGHIPLLISMPHVGEMLPEAFAQQMTPVARTIADTDWHLPRLYDFAAKLGASVVQATHSRYIIDVNRPRDGSSLYPGQSSTGLCPVETFRGDTLYDSNTDPTMAEMSRRVAGYWEPYHAALQAEVDRMLQVHPAILLWEAHSIASVLPRVFEGRLPDLNIGSFSGAACAQQIRDAAVKVAKDSPFSWSVDARFKGGYITRHYGDPRRGVHALQLEMAQCLYMDELEPFGYREDLAKALLPTLSAMVERSVAALQSISTSSGDKHES